MGILSKPIILSRNSQPLRSVQALLWNQLLSLIKVQEQDVIRSIIGNVLVEKNELLFREASALEEILQTVEEDMRQQLLSRQILDTPMHLTLEIRIRRLLHCLQSHLQLSHSEDSSCKTNDWELKIHNNSKLCSPDKMICPGFDVSRRPGNIKSRGLNGISNADYKVSSALWMADSLSQTTDQNTRDTVRNVPKFPEDVHKLGKTFEQPFSKYQLDSSHRNQLAGVDMDMAVTFSNCPGTITYVELLNSLDLDLKCRSTVFYIISKHEILESNTIGSHSRSSTCSSTSSAGLYEEGCLSRQFSLKM